MQVCSWAEWGYISGPFHGSASQLLEICCDRHTIASHAVQVLNVKLGMNVDARDLELLIEKYINDDYGDLVNYVAFSSRVDPSEPNFDPYTLGA